MNVKNVFFMLFFVCLILFAMACGDKKAKVEDPVVGPPKEELEKEVEGSGVDPYAGKREGATVQSGGFRAQKRKIWDKSRKHWRDMNNCN